MKTSSILSVLSGLAIAVLVTDPNPPPAHVSHLTRSWGARHSPHKTSLSYPYGSHYFYTNINIGTQSFTVVADLGSSNLWVPASGFRCLEIPCGVQATYNIDSSFSNITDETFVASYGAGLVLGITGFETITVAGLTVQKQQIGVPEIVSYQAYDQSSGIIGLAFPGITSFFEGTKLTADILHPKLQQPSSSIINTIFEVDKLTAPILSLALSRDTSNTSYGGVLAIGGTPNFKSPTVNASSAFARVPIEYDPTLAGKQYGHYLFNYSSVSYTNGTTTGHNDTSIQVVADSGAPTISLPAHLAKEINAMFDPPAELVDGAYIVGCDAKAPRVSFEIGGHDFSIYPPDLIYHAISNTTAKADSGYAVHCASAVQADSSGSGGFSILGEPFLKNVLGVFDWGSHEIRWHAREHYES